MKRFCLLTATLALLGCGGEGAEGQEDAGWGRIAMRFEIDGAAVAFDRASAVAHGGSTVVSASRAPAMQAFELSFPGTAAGSFTCAGGARLEYVAETGARFAALGAEGGCALEVTTCGAVGEPVAGTFTGALVRIAGTGPGQLTLTGGAFEVARSADAP